MRWQRFHLLIPCMKKLIALLLVLSAIARAQDDKDVMAESFGDGLTFIVRKELIAPQTSERKPLYLYQFYLKTVGDQERLLGVVRSGFEEQPLANEIKPVSVDSILQQPNGDTGVLLLGYDLYFHLFFNVNDLKTPAAISTIWKSPWEASQAVGRMTEPDRIILTMNGKVERETHVLALGKDLWWTFDGALLTTAAKVTKDGRQMAHPSQLERVSGNK